MFGYKKLLSEIQDAESRCLDRYEYLLDQIEELKRHLDGSKLLEKSEQICQMMEKAEERWEHLCENFYRVNNMLNEFKGLVAIVRGEASKLSAVEKARRELAEKGKIEIKEGPEPKKPGRSKRRIVTPEATEEVEEPKQLTKARDNPRE